MGDWDYWINLSSTDYPLKPLDKVQSPRPKTTQPQPKPPNLEPNFSTLNTQPQTPNFKPSASPWPTTFPSPSTGHSLMQPFMERTGSIFGGDSWPAPMPTCATLYVELTPILKS